VRYRYLLHVHTFIDLHFSLCIDLNLNMRACVVVCIGMVIRCAPWQITAAA